MYLDKKIFISFILGVVVVAGVLGWNFTQEKKTLLNELSATQARIQELEKKQIEKPKEVALTPIPQTGTNLFDFASLKVGDRIGAMTVTEIKPFSKNEPIGPWNAVIQFKGQTEIRGTWGRREFGGDMVRMDPDSASQKNLPFMKGDTRTPWFFFDNEEKARAEFGPLGGEGFATVLIDEYTYVSADADVWNGALLIAVRAKTFLYTNEKYGFQLEFPQKLDVKKEEKQGFVERFSIGPVITEIYAPARTLDRAAGKIGDSPLASVEEFPGKNIKGRLIRTEGGEISAIFISGEYEYHLRAVEDAFGEPDNLLKVYSSFMMVRK